MLVLGIDTATLTLSMALVEDGRLLAKATEPPPAVHSAILPTRLVELLAEAGRSVRDLGAIVIGLGPGSFTGLRISLATAKGICYANEIPLVGVSSLAAMAKGVADATPDADLFVPCLDARKGEVYCGFWRRVGASIERKGDEVALAPEELLARLEGEDRGRLFGLGREAYPALANASVLPSSVRTPDAEALLSLAPPIPAYSKQAVFAVEPRYVRPPDVEWQIRPKKAL